MCPRQIFLLPAIPAALRRVMHLRLLAREAAQDSILQERRIRLLPLSRVGPTINAGVVNIGTDSATNAINIGTVTSTGRVTTIGNTTGASGIAENVGTGNYVLSGATSSNVTVGTGITTGAITVGAPLTTGTITIGGTAETGTITLGSSNRRQHGKCRNRQTSEQQP